MTNHIPNTVFFLERQKLLTKFL